MAKMKTQFWAGRFENENVFNAFFKEIYSDNDDEPISKFAKSQGETWIDHDFLEIGYEENEKSINEKFRYYSYAEKWLDIFELRLKKKKLRDINALIMVNYNRNYSQIESPKSYEEDKFKIEYLGEIEYEYLD